eukprot:scaffold214108_cov28-Tisochrysis_lutea.AAC.2
MRHAAPWWSGHVLRFVLADLHIRREESLKFMIRWGDAGQGGRTACSARVRSCQQKAAGSLSPLQWAYQQRAVFGSVMWGARADTPPTAIEWVKRRSYRRQRQMAPWLQHRSPPEQLLPGVMGVRDRRPEHAAAAPGWSERSA